MTRVPSPATQCGLELQRKRGHEALVNWVLRLAQQRPLVLIFEDLHWADDGSFAFIGQLLKQIADIPRPAAHECKDRVRASLMHYPYLQFHTLDPLPRADAEHTLGDLAGDRVLAAGQRDLVLQRAGGVPLLVEESWPRSSELNRPGICGGSIT
ncbi:MAG: hypothetical protein ACT4PZ_11290 [Panacagrimonas sp.]